MACTVVTHEGGGFLATAAPIDGNSSNSVFNECVSSNNCKREREGEGGKSRDQDNHNNGLSTNLFCSYGANRFTFVEMSNKCRYGGTWKKKEKSKNNKTIAQ